MPTPFPFPFPPVKVVRVRTPRPTWRFEVLFLLDSDRGVTVTTPIPEMARPPDMEVPTRQLTRARRATRGANVGVKKPACLQGGAATMAVLFHMLVSKEGCLRYQKTEFQLSPRGLDLLLCGVGLTSSLQGSPLALAQKFWTYFVVLRPSLT